MITGASLVGIAVVAIVILAVALAWMVIRATSGSSRRGRS